MQKEVNYNRVLQVIMMHLKVFFTGTLYVGTIKSSFFNISILTN